MSVSYTDNVPSIKNASQQKTSLFLRFMTDALVASSTPKTPKKTGRLRMDVVKQVLGKSARVVWGKNYAIFQEKKQYRNYTTPGTGPRFAENAARDIISKTSEIARRAGL